MNQSAGALAVEGGRGYPLQYRLREPPNPLILQRPTKPAQSVGSFPLSGARLFVAVQSGSVLISVFPPPTVGQGPVINVGLSASHCRDRRTDGRTGQHLAAGIDGWMTNILKHPFTSTFASNNKCGEIMFLFLYQFVTLTVLVDIVKGYQWMIQSMVHFKWNHKTIVTENKHIQITTNSFSH